MHVEQPISMITSLNVGGQGDKLMEPLPLKVVADGVGLGGTDVNITDDQGVLSRVDEVFQVVSSTEERLLLGSIDGQGGHGCR